MEISKEQKEAIECLEKYTKLETYGERNLEKDIITVLELLKETQRKLEIVNDYNYWVLLAADRGIELKKLQKENEELKNQEATARRINELLVQRYSNSIPVQKVKDKIEELKQERDETYTKFLGGNRTDENLSTRGKMIEGGIKVLQELLEESE